MKRCVVFQTLIAVSTILSSYSAAGVLQAAALDQQATYVVIPVRLSSAIDSKKAKEGGTVVTKTEAALRTGNGTLIPSGTKVIGHLTESTALAKGDPQSSLGIVFDKMQLADGRELNIKGTLQAIAPEAEVDTGAAGSGTMATYGTGATTMPSPAPQADAVNRKSGSTLSLNRQSKGVVGFRDLEMGVDSVLTSTAKQIKLNSGTQMMLRVELE